MSLCSGVTKFSYKSAASIFRCTLKMEAADCSEPLPHAYQTSRSHILEKP